MAAHSKIGISQCAQFDLEVVLQAVVVDDACFECRLMGQAFEDVYGILGPMTDAVA